MTIITPAAFRPAIVLAVLAVALAWVFAPGAGAMPGGGAQPADGHTSPVQLVMFEQRGCVYCLRWDQDVSVEYPLTAEGRAAPLRRLDLHEALPADVALARPVTYTPTFVLLVDGAEAGRIEGYPGEDFFWGLLQALLARADVVVN